MTVQRSDAAVRASPQASLRTPEYTVLDVFAERAFEGNPLAVFHDGRGLSDAEMQTIAREMSLSETTFVLPAEDPQQDVDGGVRVRIFTTQEELPFAGHPTLGTASWLRAHHPGLADAEAITLRLNAGPIEVRFGRGEGSAAEAAGIFATMRQPDPVFGAVFDVDDVAGVLGLTRGDLADGPPPQSVSTGNAFCLVALRSLEVMARLAIPPRESSLWLRARGVRWFYCLAATGASPSERAAGAAAWRARMQFYGGEDPATGSAAGPGIAWLVRHGLAAPDTSVVIEQGIEMRRPSRLTVGASREGDRIVNVLVGGRTIPVASGRLFLPR